MLLIQRTAGFKSLNSDGRFIGEWGKFGSNLGEFYYPNGISLDIDGNIYVADTENNRIQKLPSLQDGLGSLWENPIRDGISFDSPVSVNVNIHGELYVTDTENHRILKFDTNGKNVTKFGSPGSGENQFREPSGIATGKDGSIYIVDTLNHRIMHFKEIKICNNMLSFVCK